MRKIRVLVVDDHQIVREGLKSLLSSDPGIEVVGEAADGEEAIAKANSFKPDVVIMDVAMPVMNGRMATVKLRKIAPSVKVLVLSSYHDEQLVRELMFAGATGFLAKEDCAANLLKAVRDVMTGNSNFSPCILDKFRHEQRLANETGRTREAATGLTPREIQVLELIAGGLTNKRIGMELKISIKTVEKHRQQVMSKLNIHEPAGLTRYALSKGLVTGVVSTD